MTMNINDINLDEEKQYNKIDEEKIKYGDYSFLDMSINAYL